MFTLDGRCTGTYQHKPVIEAPNGLGSLTDSSGMVDSPRELCQRLEEDGYLFLPGFLDRDAVIEGRRSFLQQLAEEDMLDPDAPLMDGIMADGKNCAFVPKLAHQNKAVEAVIYSERMMALFGMLFDEPARHFDYTWVRAKGGKEGSEPTYPHYDNVYMGRGSKRLHTAWTPFGDIPYQMGGLMILEGSHRLQHLIDTYGQYDVDGVCSNLGSQPMPRTWPGGFGWYKSDAFEVQQEFGGRWLTSEYRMGDVLIFGMFTMHASMDNQTDRVRLSTDSRYQPAQDPVDNRWVGENPLGHGEAGRKEYIC